MRGDEQRIIAERIRQASATTQNAQKEQLTWEMSETANRWIRNLAAAFFIAVFAMLGFVIFVYFLVSVIRSIGLVSTYPVTTMTAAMFLFMFWAKWVRGSMFLESAKSE